MEALEGGGAGAAGVDRISNLPDDVLGHILSSLPSEEAGRTALLARRWRKLFGHVHCLSFAEEEAEEEAGGFRAPRNHSEQRRNRGFPSYKLADQIGSALLARRRCARGDLSIRTFRFRADVVSNVDLEFIDFWIGYILDCATDQLHLDLRYGYRQHDPCIPVAGLHPYHGEPPCILPRLFSCATLKVLRISHCRLKLPVNVNLPMAEKLHLTSVRLDDSDHGSSIERLVSSCPSLADLTLEAIPQLRSLSLVQTQLRRFVILCCHNISAIHINASRLICFELRGTLPADNFLNFDNFPEQGIRSFTIDICKRGVTESPAEHATLGQLLQRFSHSQRLHVHHSSFHPTCLTAPDWFPQFPRLTCLVLQGPVVSRRFIGMLRACLEQAPKLQVLVLLMTFDTADMLVTGDDSGVLIPNEATFATPCLLHHLREIHLVSFEGTETHKAVAQLLLQNALVLRRLNVVFTKRPSADLKEQIEGWVRNGPEKTFSCFGEGSGLRRARSLDF